MLRFDTAAATDQGQRDYQEDALVYDFVDGSPLGFAVVADGMGGHAAGDKASQIAIQTAFGDLRQLRTSSAIDKEYPEHLEKTLACANAKIKDYGDKNPTTAGMGTTFVATLVSEGRLYWVSVGDSPLYLFRNGALQQLNEDHSLAPQIDLLVASGMMSPEDGRDHPDRNVLTSVLVGNDVPKIDCPKRSLELIEGDILLIASDGLQTLDHAQIESTVHRLRNQSSSDIVAQFLRDLKLADDPDQDNASVIAIRVLSENSAIKLQSMPSRRSQVRQAPIRIAEFLGNHFHLTPKRRSSSP